MRPKLTPGTTMEDSAAGQWPEVRRIPRMRIFFKCLDNLVKIDRIMDVIDC